MPSHFENDTFSFRPAAGLESTKTGRTALRDLNNVETADILLLVQDEPPFSTPDTNFIRESLGFLSSKSREVSPESHRTTSTLDSPTIQASEKDYYLRPAAPYYPLGESPLPSETCSTASSPTSLSHASTYPYYAHKLYLERCPYLLDSGLLDGNSPIVQITVPCNADSFYDILRYVYTQKIERRHLDPDALIGTFLAAEYLHLDDLTDACREEFAINWEIIIKSDDFTWRKITTIQLKSLILGATEQFEKEPHRKLKIILQWCRGWPKLRIHEVRNMITEEMKGGFAERLDLAELESLQLAFGADFDNVIPPSVVMKVVKNYRAKQIPRTSSNGSSKTNSDSRKNRYSGSGYFSGSEKSVAFDGFRKSDRTYRESPRGRGEFLR